MNYCPKPSSFKRYEILDGSLPSKYGNSFFDTLVRRTSYLFGLNSPGYLQSIFTRNTSVWLSSHQDFIKSNLNRKKGKLEILINLPFGRISLEEAIAKKIISIEENKIKINVQPYQKINFTSLQNDLAKEMLLTLTLSLTKTILDLLYIPNTDIYILLQCAVLLGIVKGLTKTISDTLVNKRNSLTSFPWKCSIEIFSEVATEITLYLSSIPAYLAFQSALKGFFKYLFEQFSGGTYFLFNLTELFLEVAKASFKGASRDYFSSIFMDQILLGRFFGSFLGSMLSVGLINIFIEQCAL